MTEKSSAMNAEPPNSFPLTGSDVNSYFDRMLEAFRGACRSQPVVRRDLELTPGFRCRLWFAGYTIEPVLFGALAHLTAFDENINPDLEIMVWDRQSTGEALPRIEWPRVNSGLGSDQESESHGIDCGGIQALFHRSADLTIAALYRAATHQAVYFLSSEDHLPYYEAGSPLRVLLYWALKNAGLQMVHGAAAGTERAGILFAGPGGSGKSNAALCAFSSARLRFGGDDYVVIGQEGDGAKIFTLYSSAKIAPADRNRHVALKGIQAAAGRLSDPKRVYYLNESFGAWIAKALPLSALVVPVVSNEEASRFEKISAVEGIRALAPSSLFQFPGAGSDDFARIVKLAGKVPAYRLWMGTDPALTALAIENLCDEAAL